MNRNTKIIAFLFGIFFWAGAYASSSVAMTDMIAGEEGKLSVSGLFANEQVEINISRPDQSVLFFHEQADEFGVLKQSYHNMHFQKTGKYTVDVVRDFETISEEFMVWAGTVSAYQSKIQIQNQAVKADGKEKTFFTVTLRDAFGNLVPKVSVKVFSSRNEDSIFAEQVTNEEGEIRGEIRSSVSGVSVLSVISEGVLLFEKPEIVFFLADGALDSVGADGGLGNFLKAQLFDDTAEGAGSVSYFSFDEVTPDLVIGEAFSAKVTVRDENGSIVTGYRGTVRFSSSDDSADLPADYQFTETDQGQHSFFLAFTFQTPGSQTLAVHAIADFRIHGELEREIGLGGGDVEIPQEAGLTLLTPRNGTYRSSKITLTGEAVGCAVIKLTDGPTVLTTDLPVDQRGNFLYPTPRLGDGVHIFQAFCAEDENITSNQLTIRIDQTPPNEINVEIDPTGDLAPDQPFRVTVTANEPLSTASSVFQEVLTSHQKDGEAFIADLRAPRECGEFVVNVKASDLLGNEADFPSAGIIRVTGCEAGVETGFETGVGEELGDGKNSNNSGEGTDTVAPTAVPNVSTESGDGKVTLFWSPADDNEAIDHYEVAFGCRELGTSDEISLDQSNVVPDNRTQWYVEGMTDEEECAFEVIAIDASGNEGPAGTRVFGMTNGAEQKLHASAPKDLEKSGSSSSPMVFVFAILAGFGVLVLSRLRRS